MRLPMSAIVVALAACGGGNSSGGGGNSGGPQSHTLTVQVSGNGRVTSSPPGIDCGATCTAQFAKATSVTLDVHPDAGWSFSSWSGACSGAQACSVAMSSDVSVGAAFQQAPPADECAGLLPASLPGPIVATLPRNTCVGGTSDDVIGNYLLGYTAEDASGRAFPSWQFFTIQQGTAVRIGNEVMGGEDATTFVLSQPSGFSVFKAGVSNGAATVSWYSHEGAPGPSTTLTTGFMGGNYPYTAVGVDPSGGLAAVRTYKSIEGWFSEYQRFDKSGAVESSWVGIDSGADLHQVLAVGVPLSGHALVLESINNPTLMQGRWLDRNGKPLTGWFSFAGAQFPEFHFLMDGSLVLRFGRDSDYMYRFEDAKAGASTSLPAWLQQRSGNQFFVVRGGKGYASWGNQGSCPGNLEVLAASSGKSCGCVAVPGLVRITSVGRDGSLIVPQQATCKYDLYPQLLQ